MNAPIVEFRDSVAPYGLIPSLSFVQTTLESGDLPVVGGENSDVITFRIYNNFSLQAGIASMTSVKVTVFADPFAQSWFRIYETGYGEGATTPGLYSQYLGQNTAIGKLGTNKYTPEYGSDGTTTAQIRAGSTTNGAGFIEFAVYLEVPEGVTFNTFPFTMSVEYAWTP